MKLGGSSKRTLRRAASGLAVVAVLTVAMQASADAYEAALTRAVAAKEQALDSREPSDWEEALERFRAADAVRSTRETNYEIGFAAEKLRQDDIAVSAYETAIELGLDGSARQRAQQFLERRSSGMARVRIEGPAGTRVTVLGVQRGVLPLRRPIVMFPGTSQVTLQAEDGTRWVKSLELRPGQLEEVRVGFEEPTPAPSPPRPAQSALATQPSRPQAPPVRRTTPPPVQAQPPESGSGKNHALGWTLLGSGAGVSVTAAVVLWIAQSEIEQSQARLAPLCAELAGPDNCRHAVSEEMTPLAQEEVDTIATLRAVQLGSWIGLGTGAIAAVTGAVLLLNRPGGSEPQQSALWFSPTAEGGMLRWVRRF